MTRGSKSFTLKRQTMKRRVVFLMPLVLAGASCRNPARTTGKAKQPTTAVVQAKEPQELYPVRVNGKTGFIDKNGRLVINPQFELAGKFNLVEGMAWVYFGKRCGYIDETGKPAINAQFDVCDSFSDGLAGAGVGHQMGYIDKTGRFAINPQFDLAVAFSDGLAKVKLADRVRLHR